MGGYAKFLRAFWRDPQLAGLSADALQLFVWCFTNESCRLTGIYPLDLRTAASETRLGEGRFRGAWEELLAFRKPDGQAVVEYDPKHCVVWVRGTFKMQCAGRANAKIVKGALRELTTLPPSGLIRAFRSKYKVLLIPHRYPMDGASGSDSPRRQQALAQARALARAQALAPARAREGEGAVATGLLEVDSEAPAESRRRRRPRAGAEGRQQKPGSGVHRGNGNEIDASQGAIAEAQKRKLELDDLLADLPVEQASRMRTDFHRAQILGVYADTRKPVYLAPRTVRTRLKRALQEAFGAEFAAGIVIEVDRSDRPG